MTRIARFSPLVGLIALAGVTTASAQLKPLPPFEPPARGAEVPWYPGYTAGSDYPFGRIHQPVELPRHRSGFPEGPYHWDSSREPAYVQVGPDQYMSHGRHPYVMPDYTPARDPAEQDVGYRGFQQDGVGRMTLMKKSTSDFAIAPERPWSEAGVRRRAIYPGPDNDPAYTFPRPSWYIRYARQSQPPPHRFRGR